MDTSAIKAEERLEKVLVKKEVLVTEKHSLELELDDEERHQQEKKEKQKIEHRDENDDNSSYFLAVTTAAVNANLSVDADGDRSNKIRDENIYGEETESNNKNEIPTKVLDILNTLRNGNDKNYVIEYIQEILSSSLSKKEDAATDVAEVNTSSQNDRSMNVVKKKQSDRKEKPESTLETVFGDEYLLVGIFSYLDIATIMQNKTISTVWKRSCQQAIDVKYLPSSGRVQFQTGEELKSAVKRCRRYHRGDLEYFSSKYGYPMGTWDVSLVTDFSSLFKLDMNPFHEDLSNWDLSAAIDTSHMFENCTYFDCDISKWDVKNVMNMKAMFDRAKYFQGRGLETWDTHKVQNMCCSFQYCMSLRNPDLSNWNTSNVTDMTSMFTGCPNFEGTKLSTWDTSNVANMQMMFAHCAVFNGDISRWDTSNVINTIMMFQHASCFYQNLCQWDLSRCRNYRLMFCCASKYLSNPLFSPRSNMETTESENNTYSNFF